VSRIIARRGGAVEKPLSSQRDVEGFIKLSALHLGLAVWRDGPTLIIRSVRPIKGKVLL